MKNSLRLTFSILLFAACQEHTYYHPESTIEGFSAQQIISNNLKSVKEYSRVPSTNPDSLIEPIGLMLSEEFSFNKAGKLIESRCVGCGMQLHVEPLHIIDYLKRLEYDNGLLTKYIEYRFDTTSFEVQYFNNKSLTKGYRNDKQGFTSIELYDSIGRLIKHLEFEFFNSYAYKQHIQQVNLKKVTYEYDPETTYKQSFQQTGSINMVSLTPEQFAILQSNNIEKIEDLANLYELKSIGTEVIKYSKSRSIISKRMHNTTYPDETLYEYDEADLLKMKNNKYNGHEFIFEYRYEKW